MKKNDSFRPIHERVRLLEQQVAELREMLAQSTGQLPDVVKEKEVAPPEKSFPLATAPPPTALPTVPPPPLPGGTRPPVTVGTETKPLIPSNPFELPPQMRTSEWWLGKLGIGLLLFGVIFLFKYSIDQGWITPALRIAFGLAIGAVLLFFGFRIYSKRRHFSLLLFGGGIATFYISGFAAFQIFSLVSHLTAFAFMIVVTLLAFSLSLRQNEAILSLVGTVGGLGTPFLLYTGEGNLPGLVAYTCLILAGSGSVYFYKGWRSLLWLSVAGGWTVFLIGLWDLPFVKFGAVEYNALGDRWALQAGVIFGWLTFWCMPVVRDFLGATRAGIFEHTYLGFNSEKPESDGRTFLNRYAHTFTISTPLIALFISRQTWSLLPDQTWGFVEMGFVALYVLIWRQLSKTESLIKLAQTHLFTAAILLTISLSDLFDGHTLLYALVTEALVLRVVANQFKARMFSFGSHAIFGGLAFWLFDRLGLSDLLFYGKIGSGSGTPMLNAQAIADFYAIAVSFVAVRVLKSTDARRVYFVAGFAALAALTIREFDGNVLLVLLGFEAVILHLISRLTADGVYIGAAHVFSAGIAIWLGERLLFHNGYDLIVLNTQALADLSFLGLLLVTATFFPRKEEQGIYRLFVHLALLAWFSRELSHLPNGQGFVSAAWGLYAIGLLIAGLRRNIRALRLVGLATILLVVAKLFVIDLARLETLWRILLFIGFGGLFLVISYFFKSMWKQPDDSGEQKS